MRTEITEEQYVRLQEFSGEGQVILMKDLWSTQGLEILGLVTVTELPEVSLSGEQQCLVKKVKYQTYNCKELMIQNTAWTAVKKYIVGVYERGLMEDEYTTTKRIRSN